MLTRAIFHVNTSRLSVRRALGYIFISAPSIGRFESHGRSFVRAGVRFDDQRPCTGCNFMAGLCAFIYRDDEPRIFYPHRAASLRLRFQANNSVRMRVMASIGGGHVECRERRLGPVEGAPLHAQIEQQVNKRQRDDRAFAGARGAGRVDTEEEQG